MGRTWSKTGGAYHSSFALQGSTGALVFADSLPTVLVLNNNTPDGTGGILCNSSTTTGGYILSGPFPKLSYIAGDELDVLILAIVGGIIVSDTIDRLVVVPNNIFDAIVLGVDGPLPTMDALALLFNAVPDAVDAALSAAHGVDSWLTGAGSEGDAGDGSVAVDHDYGDADALAYKTGEGAGIDNAVVQAFIKADWDAGRRTHDYIQGSSRTTTSGRWESAIMLDPGDYVIRFFRQGLFGPDIVEVTVTAD